MNYYEFNFSMVNHYGWSLETLEKMTPFERQVYGDLLKDHLEKLKEARGKG